MATFTSHAHGTPSWVDLMTPDLDSAKNFYSAVFGWELDDQFDDEGNRIYVMARHEGKATAGMGTPPPGAPPMPSVWNTYVSVDEVGAAVEAVTGAGGQVLMPPMQVMTSGHMAVCADPTGAAFSVWQALDHIGAEIGNVANTYSWNELMTRDVEAAKAFYSEVFGWTYEVSQMSDDEYHLIAGGEEGLGGIMAMPEAVPDMVPNHWGVYFSVDDLTSTVDKITTNGGQVVMGPMEAPGVGTFATVHDPAGANFSVLQPLE